MCPPAARNCPVRGDVPAEGYEHLAAEARVSGDQNVVEIPYPFCRRTGWLVSKGGWVRLFDVATTLRHPAPKTLRALLAAAGVRPAPCDWEGSTEDCVRYRDGLRVVAAARRARDPP